MAARSVIYWTDLRNETVLLSQHDPGRELEDLLISKLVSPADRPKIERHDASRGIIKSLISMKLGISLVLESDIGASFAGLIYRELRLRNPLVALRTMADRNFGTCCAIIFCAYAVLYANTISLPALLQSLFGYDATTSGLVLSPAGFFAILMLVCVGAIAPLLPTRLPLAP